MDSRLLQMLMQRQQQQQQMAPQQQPMDMQSRLMQWLKQQRQQQQQVNYPMPLVEGNPNGMSYPMPLVGPSSFPSDQMNYSPYAPYSGQG
jgi:hypothetical protein